MKREKIKHLKRALIRGYKSIKELEVDFSPDLNIVIGANASGKSNFFEAVNSMFQWRDLKRPAFAEIELEAEDGASIIYQSSEKNDNSLAFSAKERNGSLPTPFPYIEKIWINADLKIDTANPEERSAHKPDFTWILPWELGKHNYQLVSTHLVSYDVPKNLDCLDSPGKIEFSTEKATSYYSQPQTFINNIFEGIFDDVIVKGKTLNDVLPYLRFEPGFLKHLYGITSIEEIRFSPNIHVHTRKNKTVIENLYVEFKIDGEWYSWRELSDGTRRLFYLIYEITQPYDSILLIEEPELGIHPDQFFGIMTLIKEQAAQKQIFISTHAPQAMDFVNQDEMYKILITKYDNEKGTQITHLSEASIAHAKKFLKTKGLFLRDLWINYDLEEI